MEFKHTFKNDGSIIHNDQVYDQLFELIENEFTIKIKPSNSTKFWRLGIRLSKDTDIEFYHPKGRYVEPSFSKYIDIHLGAGEWDNSNWTLPNRIHLAQYNLYPRGDNHILDRKETFKESGEIDWKIKYYLKNKKSLIISYKAEGCEFFSKSFPLNSEYKYFKIFAWADMNAFEINCNIQVRPAKEKKITQKTKDKTFDEADSAVQISDDLNPVIEVKELAKEVGEILKLLKDPTGNMFGIFGKWGRGKTYLWKEILNYLRESFEKNNNKNKPESIEFKTVEFHAWKYQDTPASWAYLYELFSDKYFEKQKIKNHKKNKENIKVKSKLFRWIYIYSKGLYAIFLDNITNLVKKLRLNYFRKGPVPILIFLTTLTLFIIWLFVLPKIKWLIYLISVFGLLGFAKILYLYFLFKPKAINLLSMYSGKISFQKYLGLQAEIQKEIIFLMKSWIPFRNVSKEKILLFVDDIDRCSEEKIIQVVDSLKVMLEDKEIAKRVTILVAIDERVLKMAINVKYHDLITKSSIRPLENSKSLDTISKEYLEQLTKEYIDKLFISGIKLGDLSILEKEKIFDSITLNKISYNELPESNDAEETQTSSSTSTTTATTLSPAVETIIKEVSKLFVEIEGKEINKFEYDLLKASIILYTDATPRVIRIYYYRYLLARKIMKYKFKNNPDIARKWIDLGEKKIILHLLIIHYSLSLNPKEMEIEFGGLDPISTKKINKTIFKKTFSIDEDLYTQLLKVVEIVVPY